MRNLVAALALLGFQSISAQIDMPFEEQVCQVIDSSDYKGEERADRIYAHLDDMAETMPEHIICLERNPTLDSIGSAKGYWSIRPDGTIMLNPRGPYAQLLLRCARKYSDFRPYVETIINFSDIPPQFIPFPVDRRNRLNLEDPVVQQVVILHFYILCTY